jgi:hypothetical protein
MRSARIGWGALLLLLALVGSARAQSPFTGTWVTHNFGDIGNVIDLRVDGNRVTGTISQPAAVFQIVDGTVSGNTVTFKSGGGNRVGTYTGRIEGDRITFTRVMQVLRLAGGAGIFGTGGPMEFVATREVGGLAIPHALLGNWRDNGRAVFDPGPVGALPSVFPVRGFVLQPGGWIAFTSVQAADNGDPNPAFVLMRADGRDYPLHNEGTLTALMRDGTPSNVTRAFRVLNDRTFELVNKTNGVVTNRRRLTVSADGNTLTDVDTVVDAQGRTTATNTFTFLRTFADLRPPTE